MGKGHMRKGADVERADRERAGGGCCKGRPAACQQRNGRKQQAGWVAWFPSVLAEHRPPLTFATMAAVASSADAPSERGADVIRATAVWVLCQYLPRVPLAAGGGRHHARSRPGQHPQRRGCHAGVNSRLVVSSLAQLPLLRPKLGVCIRL